jgi:hypothetical protein
MTYQRWGKTPFTITNTDGTTRKIDIQGRDRWALECLIKAGTSGCTPLDHPGPRWSAPPTKSPAASCACAKPPSNPFWKALPCWVRPELWKAGDLRPDRSQAFFFCGALCGVILEKPQIYQ